MWNQSCSPSSVAILLVKVRIDIYYLHGEVSLSACSGSLTTSFLEWSVFPIDCARLSQALQVFIWI